jgi:hypothetical protein
MVFENMGKMQRGNPDATANAVLQLVDTGEPPLRMFLGSRNLEEIRQTYSDRIKVWEEWQGVAAAAQG